MPFKNERGPRTDPHAGRRQYGVVKPEPVSQPDPAGDTSDQLGIEIDHAAERPKSTEPKT